MAVHEREERLRKRLGEVLGTEEAHTLMERLGTMSHEHELLKRDMQIMFAELRVEMAERFDAQTKTLFRTFIVSGAVMILSVAGLAFGVALT
ncbi:MAG TPA: hypothetical protein VF058_01880 [Actinomycetota bacterium]